MDKLIYFCDGPHKGEKCYVTDGIDFLKMPIFPKLKFCNAIQMPAQNRTLETVTYKIEGNYAIFEGEDN